MDVGEEIKKREKAIAGYIVCLVLLAVVYIAFSQRVAILDLITKKPLIEFTEKDGNIVGDYVYKIVPDPLALFGAITIAFLVFAYEETRMPYTMSVTELLRKTDKNERSKWGIPPLNDLMLKNAEMFITKDTNYGIIKLDKDLPKGYVPLIIYADFNSNFKSYSAVPIVGVDRTNIKNTEFHLNRLKKYLMKKQVYSLGECYSFIAKTLDVPENKLIEAIERLRDNKEYTKEMNDDEK